MDSLINSALGTRVFGAIVGNGVNIRAASTLRSARAARSELGTSLHGPQGDSGAAAGEAGIADAMDRWRTWNA